MLKPNHLIHCHVKTAFMVFLFQDCAQVNSSWLKIDKTDMLVPTKSEIQKLHCSSKKLYNQTEMENVQSLKKKVIKE